MNEMRINRFSEEGVMKRGLTVILAALVLLTGCDGGYDNVSALSIADAESLYLVPKSKTEEAAARDAEGNVMFKITKEGIVIEVTFTNDKGETESTEKLKPTALYHANDEYFIVVYDNYVNGQQMSHLVSKTTGTVYSLENVGVPYGPRSDFENHPVVLSDGQNNLYYSTSGYGYGNGKGYELYCVNVSNPEKVFAKALTSVNDGSQQLSQYMVDVAGNVIYTHLGSNNTGVRLVFAGGGYKNLNIGYYSSYWTAPDGKLYYGGDSVYDETAGKYGYPIYRLDIEGQKVTETEYGNVDYSVGYNGYYLESGGRAYILNLEGQLLEVYNPEGKPHLVEGVPALTNIQAVTQSEEELFIAGESNGESRVIRVNPVTGAWSDLYTPGDYEVYNMVYAGGRLTVNALRMSDGAIIMGELDGTGKMKVLDEKSNSKVLYLTRIK